MASPRTGGRGSRTETGIALVLCAGMIGGWVLQRVYPNQDGGQALAPDWLPLVAAGVAAVSLSPPGASARWLRARRWLGWTALLLVVWVANGLLFDLLTLAGVMGRKAADGSIVMATVYWPGLVTRAAAFGTALVLVRLLFAGPPAAAPARAVPWYGYAAFVLALPYPVMRVHWALGGTIGLTRAGAAGEGWEPLLIAIPWVAAAVLSLFLVWPPRWMPRRLLLTAGWSATAIVATIGPAAAWTFLATLASGGDTGSGEIALWVFGLFYGSWFLWAIAGGAATRAYQLRSAQFATSGPA